MKHDHSAFAFETAGETAPTLDPRAFVSADGLLAASINAYPVVGHRTVRNDRFGPVAGLACALLLGGATFWSLASHRSRLPSRETTIMPDVAKFAPVAPVAEPAPGDHPAPVLIEAGPELNTATLPTKVRGLPEPNAPTLARSSELDPANAVTPRTVSETNHRGLAPILLMDGGNLLKESPAATGETAAAGDEPTATLMGDPASTIVQGSLIPAVLETEIDSDLPGYARAVVTRDVYSFDRSRILIPRSSRLIGEYKSGLADGQKRVYVTWTRLIRPDGVSIAIASPATSPSGETGLSGHVSSHFMQRFGSAILLTVVGAASAIGSSGLVLAGSQSAASVAATHDAQIAPTIRIRPGQPLRVFTAHDLDFSTIAAAAPK